MESQWKLYAALHIEIQDKFLHIFSWKTLIKGRHGFVTYMLNWMTIL